MGHVREISPKGLNIDVDHGFEPAYEVSEGKHEAVECIQDAAKKADIVYLASDPDREGEAIAFSVYELLDKKSQKKCKRVKYNEITKKAILEAIANAGEIDMNLVNAQKARQVLDRLVGYKVSPLVWNRVAKGTSAGRVQSIALKLICDRQKEIEDFKSAKYWFVDALLKCKNGQFWARVVPPKAKGAKSKVSQEKQDIANRKGAKGEAVQEKQDVPDGQDAKEVKEVRDNRFLSKPDAEKAFSGINSSSFELSNIEKSQRQIKPSPPFDTNSLQVACSSIYKWKADRTMQCAQSLFQAGMISYHRTDSFNIAAEPLEEIRKLIETEHGKQYLSKSVNVYSKKSKVTAQEAHECIRPTHMNEEGDNLDGDDQKLYKLIRDRFIACQMEPMTVDMVAYTVKASCGETLVASGQTMLFDGFFKVWKHTKVDEQTLPAATKGEKLSLEDSKLTEKETEPPDRYNDGSLVKKMEKEGVGRPSTWSSIIKTLEGKGYIKHDKNAIVPELIGVRINEYLSPTFKDFFMDIRFTAGLEDDLDEITKGKTDFLTVVSKVYAKLSEEIKAAKGVEKELKGMGVKCSVCKKGEIVEKFGKNGVFYACGGYPECNAIYNLADNGAFSLREKRPPPKKVGRDCPKCGMPMVQRTSSYGAFVACSGYPKCRFIEKEDKPKGKTKEESK